MAVDTKAAEGTEYRKAADLLSMVESAMSDLAYIRSELRQAENETLLRNADVGPLVGRDARQAEDEAGHAIQCLIRLRNYLCREIEMPAPRRFRPA